MQRIRLKACGLAVAAAFAAPVFAAPTVYWNQPTSGETLTGNVGSSNCYVTGSRISRVQFYVVNSSGQSTLVDTDSSSSFNCQFDSTRFPNGSYTMRAVAFDSAGARTTTNRAVRISNGTSGGGTGGTGGTPPTVSITAPANGAVWTGYVNSTMCAANASDSNGIAKVEFLLGSTLLKSDGTSPYQCSFDSAQHKDGTYTLLVRATDTSGAVSTAQRDVVLKNGNGGTTTPPPPPPPAPATGGGAINAADVMGRSLGDAPFSSQSRWSTQVMNKFMGAASVPESGIHGSVLPNGESLRFGKVRDPLNSARQALQFQLHPSDPTTSGSKRAEIRFPKELAFDKTYWTAFKMFIPDWGTLASTDTAVFGMQLHSGLASAGHPPSVGMTAINNGRNMRIRVQGSGTTRDYIQPIPFGRWVDMVFKIRQSTGSSGVMQAWMDGVQVANYAGPWGYKTAELDYFKYGYYNYSSGFNSARKVLIRSAIVVADPSGNTYSADTLRAAVQ